MKGYIKIHKMLETQNVHAFAREKLAAYGMMGEVIGTRIFDIVEKERSGETVVGLNQSLPLEKRVMAAAYGLFYLWAERAGHEALLETAEDSMENREGRTVAAKFASAFLIDESVLFQEMKRLGIGKSRLDVKEVIRLADAFVVPYRVMVRRLYEVRGCSLREYEKLMKYKDEQVETLRRRVSYGR